LVAVPLFVRLDLTVWAERREGWAGMACESGVDWPRSFRSNRKRRMDNRWLILGVLFVARTSMGFQYQTIGSVAPSLIGEMRIGFAEIGMLIGLYHISGVFLSLPGGLIVQRVGDKTLCAASLAAMASGGIISGLSHSYGVAFTGRLISGMGAILFNLVITKMAADWFARREIVLAMAVILSTWPFGIALGLFTQPRIAEAYGWRTVMLLSGGLCLLSMVLVALCYRAPPDEGQSPVAENKLHFPPRRIVAPVIAAGIMWGAFNSGVVGYFSFCSGAARGTGRHDNRRERDDDQPGALGRDAVDPARRLPCTAYPSARRDNCVVLRCGGGGSGVDRRGRAAVVRLYRVRSGDRPTAGSDHVVANPYSFAGRSPGGVWRVLYVPLSVAGDRTGDRRLGARSRGRRRGGSFCRGDVHRADADVGGVSVAGLAGAKRRGGFRRCSMILPRLM
jgi:hypothetical protein